MTDTSDYQLGSTSVKNMRATPAEQHDKGAAAAGAGGILSHVRSESTFMKGIAAETRNNASASQHKAAGDSELGSGQAELISPPRKGLHVNNKDRQSKSLIRSANVNEQMSGRSGEGSFMDAPPIPYHKRYRADIRDSSNNTDRVMGASPIKLKGQHGSGGSPNVRPFQQALPQPSHLKAGSYQALAPESEEYYAMSKKSKNRRDERGGTSNNRINESDDRRSKKKNGGNVAASVNESQNQGVPHGQRHDDPNNSKIYATPSNSNKNGAHGLQPGQSQKSQQLISKAINQSMKQNEKSQKRVNKTLSDSSMIKLQDSQGRRMSPIARMDDNEKNYKSHLDIKYQDASISSTSLDNKKKNKVGSKGKISTQDLFNNAIQNQMPPSTNPAITRSSKGDATSDVASRRKSNYLFDVKNQYGLREGGASPFNINAYQDQVTEDYSVKSMSDLCMQIVTQALSKCYNIEPSMAGQLVSDTRSMINHYRKQVSLDSESSQNKRVILSPNESSIFFNTISDRFYQKAELIIEQNSDLRPILSMILLGMQDYQHDKTKVDALKCVKFLTDINNGHFRSQIWNWIKYTTMKKAIKDDTDEQSFKDSSQQRSQNDVRQSNQQQSVQNVHIVGFIHAANDIINKVEDTPLSMLACRTLIQIAQSNLSELFLGQLPTLCTNRVGYLRMVNENFVRYSQALLEHTDEVNRTNLLEEFNRLGVPSFLIAQCLCLIEGNLMQARESQLQDFVDGAYTNLNTLSNKQSRVFQRIQDQMQLAVSLLTEIWGTWPQLFSCPQQTQMLQNEYEAEDFGLKERLSKQGLETMEQKRRLLGSKVLSLFKKVSMGASMTVQLTIFSRLFAVLEKLVATKDDFAEYVYRLLIFFLIEFHHNEVIRGHLMTNFKDLFMREKVLSLHQLVEPLCSIIESNLEQNPKKSQYALFSNFNKYMTVDDFSFFWDLANKPRITIHSAIPICKIMQQFMLKSESQYRTVAQKIFFRLLSKFVDEDSTQAFLKKHADEAICELSTVDQMIRKHSKNDPSKSNNMLSPTNHMALDGRSDQFELQLQCHYLFKHLLLLGRGKQLGNSFKSSSEQKDHSVFRGSPNFRFICTHIVNSIQNTLKIQGTAQSKILVSLLRKLTNEAQGDGPAGVQQSQLDMALITSPVMNTSLDSLEADLYNAGVPSSKQMSMLDAKNSLHSAQSNVQQVGLAKVTSHETLLSPNKKGADDEDLKNARRQSLMQNQKIIGIRNRDGLNQQEFDAPKVLVQDEENESSADMQRNPHRHRENKTTTDSSAYEPTIGTVTINSADRVFSHVDKLERMHRNNLKSNPVVNKIDEDAAEDQENSPIKDHSSVNRKEMGTDYDPPRESNPYPMNSSKPAITPSNHARNAANMQSQGMQTLPQQINKKMQVSMRNNNDNNLAAIVTETSDADASQQFMSLNQLDSHLHPLSSYGQLKRQSSNESLKGKSNEKDGQNKSARDSEINKINKSQDKPTSVTTIGKVVSPIEEEKTEIQSSQLTRPVATRNDRPDAYGLNAQNQNRNLQERGVAAPANQGDKSSGKNQQKKYSPTYKPPKGLSPSALQKLKQGQEKLIDLTAESAEKPKHMSSLLPNRQFNEALEKAQEQPLTQTQPELSNQALALSHRVVPDSKQRDEREAGLRKLPKKQKTDKLNIREALEQINKNLDHLTNELQNKKISSHPASEEYGTTLRTEIYTDGGGIIEQQQPAPPSQQIRLQNQQPTEESKVATIPTEVIVQNNNEIDEMLTRTDDPKSLKNGGKGRMLVNAEHQPTVSANFERSHEMLREPEHGNLLLKNCMHCFNHGIETNEHTTEECPINHSKLNAAQEYLTRQRKNLFNSSQYKSENVRASPVALNQVGDGLFGVKPLRSNNIANSSVPPSIVDGFKSQKILTLNKNALPEIHSNMQKAIDQEPRAASGMLRSKKISQESTPILTSAAKNAQQILHHTMHKPYSQNRSNRDVLSPNNLATYTNGPPPRSQHFGNGAVPISLPKMSDFWRGNPIGQIQYGNGLNLKTHGYGRQHLEQSSKTDQKQPIQRYHTVMSQEEDRELSEQFAIHNRKLLEKQSQMLLRKSQQKTPNRSATQSNLDNQYGSGQNGRYNSNQMNLAPSMKKTGYSCFSGKTQAEGYKKIAQQQQPGPSDRKQEVRRLENALERLLINLGTDQEEPEVPQIMHGDEYFVRDDVPSKSNAEGNKIANEMTSVIDSYINSNKNGMGIESGPASPMQMEVNTEEEIDIVRPPTYDPSHPGLANLSPDQLAALKKLAHMNDNDIPMTDDQLRELEDLLNLMENGIPIDGNHPGMINLTPRLQQPQFLKLLNGEKRNQLSPKQLEDLDEMKNIIVHGLPLNSEHPGVVNLSPDQFQNLLALENKQDRQQPLRPEEDEDLCDYKETIAHGIPVDSNHPGVVNLTENEKDKLKSLESKGPNSMTPSDKDVHNQLKNEIVHGMPLDRSHPGFKNLTPLEAEKFKELDARKKRQGGNLEDPQQKKALNSLQEMIKGGDLVDDTHPGFKENLTPLQQDNFKDLKRRKDQLSPDENRSFDQLRDQILKGKPLDMSHPGVSHLTPRQQLNLKGMLRRRNNGDNLPPDDVKTLQNIQNLMLNGKPLNARHPGYKKLRPSQRDMFDKLADEHRKNDIKGMKPEDADKLEKLAGAIQLGSGPFDLDHEGVHNLVPAEETVLKDILGKQAKGQPLNPNDQDAFKFLKDTMRPAIPYDKLHPNFDQLTPADQRKLLDFNKRIDAGDMLAPQEDAELQRIKDSMNEPIPLDENHPGWNNLIAPEKERFRELRAQDDEEGLNPEEDSEFTDLKDVIKNGRPLDDKHPGFNNLNPNMQKRFKDNSKKQRKGLELNPDEVADMDKLGGIMMTGVPIDEHHPGFKGLDPTQKKRFKSLKKKSDQDPSQLGPTEKKELDQLKVDIFPEEFSQPMNNALNNLFKKQRENGKLDPEEQDRKARLVELKRSLPHATAPQDGLTDEENDKLGKYLAMRVFEEPMTPRQMDELDELLHKDRGHTRDQTPTEAQRMKELARILYRTCELEPEEEKELEHLHAKQNQGIGNLTPKQAIVLQGLEDHLNAGQPFNDRMQRHYDFLTQLQNMPSCLNPLQEDELVEMEERNKNKDISKPMQNRLKAFWRMKYHPVLMNLEDRALFYAMKDLEALPELQPQEEDMLFALQKRFNCLPFITPEQLNLIDYLNDEINQGNPISSQQQRDLDKLMQLPRPEEQTSEFPGLTPPESREFKKLKAKRDKGEAMTPDELKRYKDLKDKIKKAQDLERAMKTPPHEKEQQKARMPGSALSRQKSSNLRTPDNKAQKPKRMVTYAPEPSEFGQADSLMIPSLHGSVQSPQLNNNFGHSKTLGAQGHGNEDVSPEALKQKRKAAQHAFKRAMKRGNCTLKELIDQFFIIEERYMLKDYRNGLQTSYQFAQAMAGQSGRLSLQSFFKYANDKKVKFKQHQVIEILRDESRHDDITYASFIKLLILASCGGDRTKIGISNYKKLMLHMDIFK